MTASVQFGIVAVIVTTVAVVTAVLHVEIDIRSEGDRQQGFRGNTHSPPLREDLRARSNRCTGRGTGCRPIASANRSAEDGTQHRAAAHVYGCFLVRADAAVSNVDAAGANGLRVASTP